MSAVKSTTQLWARQLKSYKVEELRRVVDVWESRERHKLDEEKRARAEAAEEEQIRC